MALDELLPGRAFTVLGAAGFVGQRVVARLREGAHMSQFTLLGASGYIGNRLVQHLQAQGHTVWAPARGDTSVLNRSLGHVLYCIGLTADFRERPFDTVDAHVTFLAQVLQQAQFDSLLYLSSTRVYMGAVHTDEDALLTVQPSDPSYLYNLTKLTGESLCHSSQRIGVRVARLSNVVGPDMDASSGNFIASLLHAAHAGHVLLQSAPESAKDYVHIDDVVDWLPRITLGGQSSTYNVASSVQTAHAQWLDWLVKHTGCSCAVKPGAPMQYFLPINTQRLQAEFGKKILPLADWLINVKGKSWQIT